MKSKLLQVILLLVVGYVIYRFGIRPPIPSSLVWMYMGITVLAVFLFYSSDSQAWLELLRPLKDTLVREERRLIRIIIFVLFPILVGFGAYRNVLPSLSPPAELRVVHPSPPSSIDFRGKNIQILGLKNPLSKEGPEGEKHLAKGEKIYFENCFFCHGDNLDGKGHFAVGLNPPPADFTDTGTIAQLQESYVFWRIAKGGPGLPKESAPWNSSMPAWENRLTDEEVWQVTMYIYQGAGVKPRTWD